MERKAKQPATHGLVDLAPAQVDERLAEIAAHLDAIDALLLDAEGLNAAQRRKVARLRGQGEVAALTGILEFTTAHPELFASLASVDNGADPTRFEPDLLLNRLQNAESIGKMADRFAATAARLSSCALNAVDLMKPTTMMAYDIAKAVAGRVSQSELLHPAQDFYQSVASAAARTRARNKAARAKTASKPAGTEPPGVGRDD